jgi:arsenate reductase
VKKKVLFLCIGNSCRSQMAEGFARRYGGDVMEVQSAGLAPASIVQPLTRKVMADKNISLDGQFPKDLSAVNVHDCDLVVNMSGTKLSTKDLLVRDWPVDDPIGCPEEVYVRVRDEIEMGVMQLILELRRQVRRHAPPPRRRPAPAAVK